MLFDDLNIKNVMYMVTYIKKSFIIGMIEL